MYILKGSWHEEHFQTTDTNLYTPAGREEATC